jgi:serine/threonine protein kinase
MTLPSITTHDRSAPATRATSTTQDTAKLDTLQAGLLVVNAVVKDYRITSLIRSGQSNNVYAGVNSAGMEVAIKEYFPRRLARRLPSGRLGVADDRSKQQFEAGVKGFVNEAVALAAIKSPLLSQYVTAFRENNTAYLVTRLEPGETMEQWVRRRFKTGNPPDEQELRLLFWILLNAVQAMHDAGFLHLDIKPSNVIMRDEVTPILIDLGGARRFPQSGPRDISVSNYTPGFAAPEQHAEQNELLAPCADVYGVGTSILFCMTGRVPPLASERVKNDTLWEYMSRCGNRYSPEMIQIVESCVALDIKKRQGKITVLQNLIQ